MVIVGSHDSKCHLCGTVLANPPPVRTASLLTASTFLDEAQFPPSLPHFSEGSLSVEFILVSSPSYTHVHCIAGPCDFTFKNVSSLLTCSTTCRVQAHHSPLPCRLRPPWLGSAHPVSPAPPTLLKSVHKRHVSLLLCSNMWRMSIRWKSWIHTRRSF